MTARVERDLQNELIAVCAAVQESVSGRSFDRDRSTLSRVTSGGMTHVVYFYLSPSGPPPQVGIPDRGSSDTFTVTLGARADGFTRDSRAFPLELDLDVSVGIGEVRRRAWDPKWSLSQPATAVEEVAGLLNTSGERWFARFDSVDRSLETLESLAPEDETKTWLSPRLIAMRIRAQRGEFEEARRDLEEHLARPGYELPGRALPYGVVLARAVAYGVAVPTGSEAYISLGQAWRATRLVNDDRRVTSDGEDSPFPVNAYLDRITRIPVISFHGAEFHLAGATEAQIVCEVAGFLQHEISEELQTPWPSCPSHDVSLNAQEVESRPVWYCRRFAHAVSAIGELPQSDQART